MAVDLVLNKDAHSFAYCKELQYILEYDILIFFKNIFSASLWNLQLTPFSWKSRGVGSVAASLTT